MEDERKIFIHCGGRLVRYPDGKAGYEGGRTKIIFLSQMSVYEDIVKAVCEKMKVTMTSHLVQFTLKGEPCILVDMEDDDDVKTLFKCNDNTIHMYLVAREGENLVEAPPLETQRPIEINSERSVEMVASCNINVNESNLSGTIMEGGVRSCVDGQQARLQSCQWRNVILGSGHVFQNANEFRNAVYLMSVSGRFKYHFKRNRPTHMTVVCKVEACPWKITCRRVGEGNLVKVHTFNDVHNHNIADIALAVPDVKVKHAGALIDPIIRGTPDYAPRQICKDFMRLHGVNLTYNQAWNMKEKAKRRINGEPKNYYKLLPWLCERICTQNPNSRCVVTHDEGRFKQLFLAHDFCINGFLKGCRPIIAIDSSHMSGPYRGSLLTATAYDADDGMFPLAIGVVSSENYEDWHWFLQQLKSVIGTMDVIIISDRHPALLVGVPEVFGPDNHVYCYRHLKENFSVFANMQKCKGKNGKKTALALLDSIAYARVSYDYNASLLELSKFYPELAFWVESNSPEHWALSKYPKKRWDKMSTQLAECVNSWLKTERHHDICSFIMEHMHKMVNLFNRHKDEGTKWKEAIGPKTSITLQENMARSEAFEVMEFFSGKFLVRCGHVQLHVDLVKHQCTCLAWDQTGIPCDHACAAIRKIHQNPLHYFDDVYYSCKQTLIYAGSFTPIDTHDMPCLSSDGVVRDIEGNVVPSLKPPQVKRPTGRPKKKRIESQHQDKSVTMCSTCHKTGHNRATCKNPHVDTSN